MTLTTVATANEVEDWLSDYYAEFLGFNQFASSTGTKSTDIIQICEKPSSDALTQITIPLVAEVSNTGRTGNQTLEGSEIALTNYGFPIGVATWRNAVAVHEADQDTTKIDLLRADRDMLMQSHMTRLRDRIVEALGSIDGVDHATAVAADSGINTWLTNNEDRVLFGDAWGNTTSGDYSASIDAVTAAMTLDAATLMLMKRRAMSASPKIRPYMSKESNNESWYQVFTTPQAFRDLEADTVIQNYHQNALNRGSTNPLYRDGDIIYRGCVVRQVEEIATLGPVGDTASAYVDPVYFCGAQSVGWAIHRRVSAISEVRDYNAVKGAGVRDRDGIEKLRYNDLDHGVLTAYVGAAVD